MSEKKPTIEELEKRLAGIKNTKSRMDILTSIARDYSYEINNKYSPLISKAESRKTFKNPDQKKDVEQLIAAINAVTKGRYKLRYDVVCKIADANTLTFVLDYNYENVPEWVAANKESESLKAKKDAQEKKLAEWKRKMLFRVANGEDFTNFTIE